MRLGSNNVFPLPEGLTIAGADTDSAIEQVWERDNAAYGEEDISLGALKSWFSAYGAGGLYVWQGLRIIAGFGLWPLRKESYNALLDGSLDENSIGPDHFGQATIDHPCAFWNFSGVFVEPEYRRTTVLPSLLNAAFTSWALAGAAATPCSIVAIGLSEAGIQILTTLEMTRARIYPNRLPRFEININLSEGLTDITERINRRYRSRLL